MISILDDKLARIKRLIAKREELDAELSQLLGITEKAKRGRQPKPDESIDEAGAESMGIPPTRSA